MEWLLVDNHHAGCMLCQTVKGPFVVCSAASYTVETVNGPVPVDTPIVFCASNEGREGCIGHAARVAGYIAPDQAELWEEQARDLHDKIEGLEGELADAHANRVVPVEKLLELIGEEPASASAA